MPDSRVVLEISELTKSFPGVLALDRIGFDLRKGEVHALIGENGAGKSTLVKLISGAYRKDAGTIRLNGRICDFHSPRDAYQSGISVIYQETSLIPQLSVIENIFLGMEDTRTLPGYLDRKKMATKFAAVSRRLNFDLPRDSPARELSIAQQKMAEILKAMVRDAAIIIMDEPTDSLSATEIRQLFGIVSDLRKSGISIIYITHYLQEVFKICDRVTVLRDGRKVATKAVTETDRDEVVKLMIGREQNQTAYREKPATRSKETLRVENLSRRPWVSDVSFAAYRGEVLGLTGVVGAGKTELARMLFGADRPSGGQIFLKSQPVQIRSPREAVKLGFGMLPEDRKKVGLLLNHALFQNLTLAALAQFCRGWLISRAREVDTAEKMRQRLGIKVTDVFQAVKYLSGGNQQKVVVGKWLTSDPNILIMDEPTRGIDVGSKAEIYQITADLAAAGKTVLFISSEVPEIVQVADRILAMKNGRIAAVYERGATQQEITRKLLED